MSGRPPQPPVVDLVGSTMSALVEAIPATEGRTGRPVIVIGGLAAVCRLRIPHRATSDLDTVNRRRDDEVPQLEVLVASGAELAGPAGVLVPTSSGSVRVDVLEVSEADIANPPDDPSGRLHITAHAWAAESATPVTIRAAGVGDITVKVSEAGPLIAMKLQSLPDRSSVKEGSDLFDIVRLTLDTQAGSAAREQLREAELSLRQDAALHVEQWFRTNVARSLRLVKNIPEAADLVRDDLDLVGEILTATLLS